MSRFGTRSAFAGLLIALSVSTASAGERLLVGGFSSPYGKFQAAAPAEGYLRCRNRLDNPFRCAAVERFWQERDLFRNLERGRQVTLKK